MRKRPYKIKMQEEGRGRVYTSSFATLAGAMRFIYSHWQGEDYADGKHGFHTDYSTFSLVGFTLLDIGDYRVSGSGYMWFEFRDEKDLINALPKGDALEIIQADVVRAWEESGVCMTLNDEGNLQLTESLKLLGGQSHCCGLPQ